MKNSVQSLWVGSELSELEVLSIKSFQKVGHKFILYTYEKIKNIPTGTIIKDGNTIMKKKDLLYSKTIQVVFPPYLEKRSPLTGMLPLTPQK